MIGQSASGRAVPLLARELAGRLSVLFERDVVIIGRLNDAQHRLRDANERLWSDAFGLVDDGAAIAGSSPIVALMADARRAGGFDTDGPVLGALQQTHWAIRRAFGDYQDGCEERRQLAVEVGEVSQQLTDALCAAGWSSDDAQDADVHKLAKGEIQ